MQIYCRGIESETHIDLNGNNLGAEGAQAVDEALTLNGSVIGCDGFSDRVDELCKRNQEMHRRVRLSVFTFLSVHQIRRSSLNEAPKEIVSLIGDHLWKTRTDVVSWSSNIRMQP